MSGLVPNTPRAMTRRQAAFHPSAEQYRARANLIRGSIGASTGDQQSAILLEMALQFEQLAATLERMRTKRGLRSYTTCNSAIGALSALRR
jgi:hypothetical protein